MLRISDAIRSTGTRDGRVVLNLHHGQMFSINVVGSKILELIEQGWDEALIVDEIGRAYEMPIEIVRTDVHDFIENLSKHHILQD
jgi:hypothetical protein